MKNNKFRVWCKDFNEWEKDQIFLSEDGIPYHFNHKIPILRSIRPENHIVQFSTGILDKNGVEIYDGDILKGFWMGSYGTKCFKNPSFWTVKWDDLNLSFYMSYDKENNPPNDKFRTFPQWKKCEVVGNIFEGIYNKEND